MRAKEYLKNRQKTIYYYNEVARIVNELYKIRHDKEETKNYYERILTSDIRYDVWKKEYTEWQALHAEYGASDLEPIWIAIEGEVERVDADNIRKELLKVVKNDNTFKYITCLLSNQSYDSFLESEEKVIDNAIIEELTDRLNLFETRVIELKEQLEEKNDNNYNTEEEFLNSEVYLSERTGAKIDYIRIINCLYELDFFTNESKNKITKKRVFSAFGETVNRDLSNYSKDFSRSLSDSTKLEKHLEIFDLMKEKMTDIFNSK